MNIGFLPDVQTTTSNFTLKPIAEIKIGEKVFSNPSCINEVKDIKQNNYVGDIFYIRCKGQVISVKATTKQKFFGVKKEIHEKCRKKYGRMEVGVFEKNISLINANDLKVGDMLIIPKNRTKNSIKSIYSKKFISSFSNYIKVQIPQKLFLTNQLSKWFGLYLAEGAITFTSNKKYERKCSGVSFTINSNEQKLFRELISSGKEIFNINPRVREFPERHGRRLEYFSTQLGELMFSLFNTGSSTKKIHPCIMQGPQNFLKGLVDAWLEGDGWIDRSINQKGRHIGNSTSFHLVNQLYMILINLDKLPGVYLSAHRGQNRKKAREMGFYLRNPLFGIQLPQNIERCHRKQNDLMVFSPIREIKQIYYNGPIYNLKVKDNNAFQCNFYWVVGSE
jgi:Fe-S cluster assembly protein SufB